MPKILHLLIFAAAAVLFPGLALAAEPATDDDTQPAIWLLSDEDTRIWLFGTVHVIPPALDWRSDELDAIIEQVDELVLETDNSAGVFEKPELMYRFMLRDTPQPVLDRIAPEYHNRYRLLMKNMGMGVGDFDTFETWAVSLMLIMMANADFAGDLAAGEEPSGVEIELSALFDDSEKPISGVETQNDQLAVFSDLSADGQRALLQDMLEDVGNDPQEYEEADSLDSWLTGDLALMDSECDDLEDLPPESFRRLVTDRNRAWTDWLADRLEQPGDILFAVGACHLAGGHSLQIMLAERGLNAERIH